MLPPLRAADKCAWQKRIRRAPALQESGERIRKQNNGAHYCKGELKACREEFVCVPAEKKECRGSETVKDESFSVEKETTEQNRAHYRRSHTRNMESGDCSIAEQQRND